MEGIISKTAPTPRVSVWKLIGLLVGYIRENRKLDGSAFTRTRARACTEAEART